MLESSAFFDPGNPDKLSNVMAILSLHAPQPLTAYDVITEIGGNEQLVTPYLRMLEVMGLVTETRIPLGTSSRTIRAYTLAEQLDG